MSFAERVHVWIRAAIPAPQITTGRIESASPDRVWVSGLGDQSVACDWSASFAAEMAAPGADLDGQEVEVHVIDGQNVIAYTIVIGDKPHGV